MLNRRGFLSLLGAAVSGAVLDPERLLWVPGRKTISIPQPAPIQAAPEFLFDPNSEFVIIHETITKDEFIRRYPNSFIPDERLRPSPIYPVWGNRLWSV